LISDCYRLTVNKSIVFGGQKLLQFPLLSDQH